MKNVIQMDIIVNNIQVGTATIGAIGKGNYRGTVETTFKLMANRIDINITTSDSNVSKILADNKDKIQTHINNTGKCQII